MSETPTTPTTPTTLDAPQAAGPPAAPTKGAAGAALTASVVAAGPPAVGAAAPTAEVELEAPYPSAPNFKVSAAVSEKRRTALMLGNHTVTHVLECGAKLVETWLPRSRHWVLAASMQASALEAQAPEAETKTEGSN